VAVVTVVTVDKLEVGEMTAVIVENEPLMVELDAAALAGDGTELDAAALDCKTLEVDDASEKMLLAKADARESDVDEGYGEA
jgi:hypothetical protein